MIKELEKNTFSKFKYIDSSEQEDQIGSNNVQTHYKHSNKECRIDEGRYLIQNDYALEIKQIVKDKVDKQFYGNALLLERNDQQIKQNILKRNEKYKYFIKQLEIDHKYRAIIQKKAKKLRMENERKKQILKQKKFEQRCQTEQALMRKCIITKKDNQKMVLKGLRQFSHKLKIQKVNNIHKDINHQIQQQRKATSNELTNLEGVQRNELNQLREKYEAAKAQKRINKLDQQKNLKELKTKIQLEKARLQQKHLKNKDFII